MAVIFSGSDNKLYFIRMYSAFNLGKRDLAVSDTENYVSESVNCGPWDDSSGEPDHQLDAVE
jgi:hypothetical protein